MMKRLLSIVFWALFVMAPFMFSSLARADTGLVAQPETNIVQPSVPALQPCPVTKGINVAETSQAECCKGHKGICGCRAGKIVCCDGTASAVPGCACHGDDGFLE
jgi:hypothetical protein